MHRLNSSRVWYKHFVCLDVWTTMDHGRRHRRPKYRQSLCGRSSSAQAFWFTADTCIHIHTHTIHYTEGKNNRNGKFVSTVGTTPVFGSRTSVLIVRHLNTSYLYNMYIVLWTCGRRALHARLFQCRAKIAWWTDVFFSGLQRTTADERSTRTHVYTCTNWREW